jgi:undecaprenyl-diphosphatase
LRAVLFSALSGLLALAAFFGLAYEVVSGATRRLDTALLLRTHETFPRWMEYPMIATTALGYYSVVAVLALFAAFLFYRKGLRSYALYLPVCAFGDMVLATIVKDSVDRVRPHLFHFAAYPIPSSYSFTSGHANMAIAFYGVLAVLLAWQSEGWRRWSLVVLGAIVALLIGFSRVYLGVHYPSDVLGGYLLGTFWAAVVGAAFLLWRLMRTSHAEKRAER